MPSIKSRAKPKLNSPTASWQFEAIGTGWWIEIFEPIKPGDFLKIQKLVYERIENFDQTYSRFRADSLITQISKQAGVYGFPDDAARLFDFYRDLYDATSGAVTPLIGDLLSAAGYDSEYSLQPKKLVKPSRWDDTLAHQTTELTVKAPVILDFGAAGKGYLVDILTELIESLGIKSFCIDASGDMVAKNKALRVGLEHPDDASQVIGVINLKNQALCGSAGNRRAWSEYHHIMNPFTLKPVKHIKAVWVTAADAMTADGLATALFFVEPNRLRQFSFEYLIISDDNHVLKSSGFAAEMFTGQA